MTVETVGQGGFWKERPADVIAEARNEVSGQRRREIAGRQSTPPPRDQATSYGRGPFLVRDPKDYPTYPKSGMFRFHGYAKGYMYRWDLFLRGRTDEVPPTFNEYIQDEQTAREDTRAVEKRFLGGHKKPESAR
jgi:hypothetical protein